MKKSLWLPLILVLETFAFLVGVGTYLALRRTDHSHVVIMTIGLGIAALAVPTIIVWTKSKLAPTIILAVGAISLTFGFFAIRILDYHERAGLGLGLGIICIMGGLAAILLPRSLPLAFAALSGLGGLASIIGLYFLKFPIYRRPVTLELVVALTAILIGLIGMIIAKYRERMTSSAVQNVPTRPLMQQASHDEQISSRVTRL